MAGVHALIAPSSLDRTIACNAWIQLSAGLPPEPDDESTKEGNAADWVAKQYARGTDVAYGMPTPIPGYKVEYDMIVGAMMWRDTLGYGANFGVPVFIDRIHEQCWGEPDGWRYDAIEGVLRVPDYKFGYGVVEAFENWQTIAYAIGLLDTLKLDDQTTDVELIIVQPRAYHRNGPVRRWKVRGDKLRGLANQAHHAAISALREPGTLMWNEPLKAVVGPQCFHCPARSVCETFQQATSQAAQFAGTAMRTNMTPASVGAELAITEDALRLLEAKHTALAAQAEAFLRGGKQVPNYVMAPGRSPEKWNDGVKVEDIVALGQLAGVSLRKAEAEPNSRNSTVLTPTQAREAFKASKVDGAVISEYATKPPGAMKLARDNTTEARRAFGAEYT